jgi:hypothetical protein
MKFFRILNLIFTIVFLSCQAAHSQVVPFNFNYTDFDSTSALRTQLGYMLIGEQQFVGGRINPEIHFGKFGFGIDIPIFFNVGGSQGIRNEEYRQGVGAARLISYVRYGVKKRDRWFFRWGTIDRTNIGFGGLVNNFTNATSFERRKVGLSWDVRPIKVLGFEGLYSDFNGGTNLLSLRPYVRPLAFLEDNALLRSIEVGYNYVSDSDKNFFDFRGDRKDTKIVQSGVSAWMIDGGINLVNKNQFTLSVFTSFGQINKVQALADSVNRYLDSAAVNPTLYPVSTAIGNGYQSGKGFNLGVQARIDAVADALQFDVRLERLWQQEHYLPQFFDANYEIDKDAKLWLLANASEVQGTYGALSALIIKKLRLTGGLQIPDRVTDQTPALVHLSVNANEIMKNVVLQGNYIKGRLGNLADAFKLDDRSLLTARAGYKLSDHIEIGVNYRWTFARVENENGEVRFEPTSLVMPYFGLNFNLGKKKE